MNNSDLRSLIERSEGSGYTLLVLGAAEHLNQEGLLPDGKLRAIMWRLAVSYNPFKGEVTDLTRPPRKIIAKYNNDFSSQVKQHLKDAEATGDKPIPLTLSLVQERAPILAENIHLSQAMLDRLGKIVIWPYGGKGAGSWTIPYNGGLAIGVAKKDDWFGFPTQLALVFAMLNGSGVHVLGPDVNDCIGLPLIGAMAVALGGEDQSSLYSMAAMLIESIARKAPAELPKASNAPMAKRLQKVILKNERKIWSKPTTVWAIEEFVEISRLLGVEGNLVEAKARLVSYLGETGLAYVLLASHLGGEKTYTIERSEMMKAIGAIGPH